MYANLGEPVTPIGSDRRIDDPRATPLRMIMLAIRARVVVCWLAAGLAGCSVRDVRFTPDNLADAGMIASAPRCGDGVVDPGEQCDDGDGRNAAHLRCNAMCRLNVCGDGDVLTGVEECDDGNTNPNDSCDNSCKAHVPVRYDVAYIDQMTISAGSFSIGFFVAVVNTGLAPLSLASVTIDAVNDDSAATVWSFAPIGTPPAISLQPGKAGGAVGGGAETLINGILVTEPYQDMTLNFVMNGSMIPQVVFDLHATATLHIDGVALPLPFVIHFIPPTGSGSIHLDHASRLRSP
jgi:cysteine-rich repeat protein